ncbi:hypothetical protein L1887_18373 [Cichorium endivia]|nr:hypothetical protein L1887_18373 [Cichorium endivia]
MDPQSFKIFSETAYCCLKEQPSQRPNIDQILIELTKALKSQRKRGNPVYNSMVVGTSKSIKGTNLEHLQIPLLDIKMATENFAEEYLIGSGTYGDVYKAELDHFDCNILMTSEVQSEGTQVYLDPEYDKNGKLKNESDIYSFGVVLFEMLSGTIANDPIYTKYNSNGIAPVARRRFNEGTIKEMIDRRLMEEAHEFNFYVNKGPDQDSLDAYAKIAYQCVAETQVERPTAEVVIKKLEEALSFQENPKDRLKFSLADITLATKDFSKDCLISSGGYVYKGELTNANGCKIIAAKRFARNKYQEEPAFLTELEILLKYQHENIIGLVGYCNEMSESIIAYEYTSRTSLDRHLADNGLTWIKRLEICIGIASGLEFLHGEVVIHKDFKSSNILLNDDWIAKITHFGYSKIRSMDKDMDFIKDNGYCHITKESNMCSFGLVLLEILCGRLAFEYRNGKRQPLTTLFKRHYKKRTLSDIVFEGIKEQIVPKSLSAFEMIVYQCLFRYPVHRPTASEVLLQLRKALEFQTENTYGNTMDTANRVIAAKTNELVPPLAQHVSVSPDSHADQPENGKRAEDRRSELP